MSLRKLAIEQLNKAFRLDKQLIMYEWFKNEHSGHLTNCKMTYPTITLNFVMVKHFPYCNGFKKG